MKHLLIPGAFALLVMTSCNESGGGSVDLKTQEDSLSYALGVLMGEDFVKSDLTNLNYELLVKAIKDHSDSTEAIDVQTADQFIRAYFKSRDEAKTKEYSEKNKAFLEENKAKEGVKTTDSGLQYKVLNLGTGPVPDANDSVQVHYVGRLIDGTEFDSSVAKNVPFTFVLSNPMITGFVEGVKLMPEGSKFEFFIPEELGYGDRGMGRILPRSTLIFEVELLKVYPVN